MLEQVNIEIQDFSSTSAFPFSLTTKVAGGGTVKLTGKAGPLDQADAAQTPVNASLNVAGLDLALSRLNDWAPTIAGIVSFDGTGNSDGKSVRVDGKLKADKLKLARNAAPATRTVEFDFSVQHDVKSRSGVLSQGDIHIGGAQARLTGSYAEQGDSMALKMNLAGSNMPVPELAGLLPALGIVLPAGSSLRGGVASAKLSMDGPAERLVTTGSAALNNTKLAGFDMGKKMSTIEKLAGIKSGPDTEIQTLSLNVRYAPEGANMQNIKLVVAGIGDISGSGAVSPSDALDFKMSATVQTTGLAAVMGHTPIPFQIQGTASDPVFRPDMKGLAAGELKGLADPGKAAGGILKGIFGGKKKN